jgi:choline dehydrogenase
VLGALLWTASSSAGPDELDLHVVPMHPDEAPFSPTGAAVLMVSGVVLPESAGSFRLASRDPLAAPVIDLNFAATGRDRARLLESFQITRRIFASPKLSRYIHSELSPGDTVQDEKELADVIQANLVSYSHPVSTAPMGGDGDPAAVVDSQGRVKGIEALRVVDASIFPELPSVNINPTVIMVAERIARTIAR